MGLNIEELLKLDRLRDTKVEGTGIKRTVEICRDADKVLKETEEHIYETVEVIDGAFVKKKGIVDEIVRMTFYDETYERSLNNHYRKGKERKELHGFYLRYKQTDESHPFNLLFRKAEKAYMSKFQRGDGKKSSEEYFEEDHRSEARLLTFEILAGANELFNRGFRKKFNLDITNTNDFKIMLLDLELSKIVQSYIVKTVAVKAYEKAMKGKNSDYIIKRKKVKGVEQRKSKQINTVYLDNKIDDGTDYHELFNDDEFVEELHILDKNNNSTEDNIELKGLYWYLNKNAICTLTDRQRQYFEDSLDESLIKKYSVDQKSRYKKTINNKLDTFLEKNNKYVVKLNDKYDVKNIDVIETLEYILDNNTNLDRFNKLVEVLEKDNYVCDYIIDCIYDLDHKYLKPLITYLTNKDIEIDEDYIDSSFIYVLNKLNAYLNDLNSNCINIYMFNKQKTDEKEYKIKKYVEDELFKMNKDEGVLTRRKVGEYACIDELFSFMQETLTDRKIRKNQVRDVLNEFGYDLSKNPTRTIQNVPSYRVYRRHS